jgi:hypothetical protein
MMYVTNEVNGFQNLIEKSDIATATSGVQSASARTQLRGRWRSPPGIVLEVWEGNVGGKRHWRTVTALFLP